MVTLHAYILRELLKSFGLSVLALTVLFTMGGGLYNVLKFEGVTASDIFTVLPMLIPIVITLTMPVAALFATTMTYGRLAADNELVAARAAGINIHRLFFSAILLSVFVALFTMLSVNLVIPRFMEQIAHFARGNVRDLAFYRLMQRGYINQAEPGKDHYMLTAQQVLNVAEDQLIEKGFDPPGNGIGYFWVERPTFLMTDKNGRFKRCSVAEGGLVQFDTREQDVKFTLYVKDARDYEFGKRVVRIRYQKIGPYSRAIPFTPKPSMVDLNTLSRWDAAPWEAPKHGARINAFLSRLGAHVFCDLTTRRLIDGETLVLHDADGARYEITAGSVAPAGRSQLVLNDVRMTRYSAENDVGQIRPSTRYEAAQAKLRARTRGDEAWVEIELNETTDRPVLEFIARADDPSTQRERKTVHIDDLQMPEYVSQRMAPCTASAVLDPAVELPTDDELAKQRTKLQKSAQSLQRKIAAVIHFRLSFASSALVTILMGAALGVIFRGSRALAAFGLACIPFLIAAILIMMGRQLIESQNTQQLGPFIIWGGLVLVGLADAVILRVGVRR